MEATILNLLLFSSLLLSPITPSRAADTLGKGGNITGDETLVSAGGTFTLGFFSLGAPTKRYYLGIWFTVSREAICWVGNRERPLQDNNGVLVISDTGSLLLRDGSGQIAWSSNSTASSSSVEAQLLDSGNLVVRDPGSSSSTVLLWQSFDHPSNTLLSGMKLGKDLWNGVEWYLTSWRSADDPYPGAFRRVLDTSGRPDLIVWQGDVKKYRTGPWNGRWFSGVPEVSSYSNLVTYQVTTIPDEISYGYTAKAGAPLTRVVVMDTGVVRRLGWDANARTWQKYFEGPRDAACDTYGNCGAFGLCDAGAASTSFCGCVRGFSPASQSAWNLRDFYGGCRRNVALQCSSSGVTTDGFVPVKGVKLPDTHNASVDTGITVKECRRRCRANCSCVAYAAADIRGGGSGSGCIIWTADIVDLRYVDQGQDLYLRLAKSELVNLGDIIIIDKDFPLSAVVAPLASTVAVVIMFLLIWWRTKRSASAGIVPQDQNIGVLRLDLPIVKEATGDFSRSHVIGEGGFAIVYQGELPDGRTVAVKRLKQSALTDKGKSDFEREVLVMASLRHGNLLRLLAYCNEGNERVLIYAYMRNKSLDLYIFGTPSPTCEPRDRAKLNWRQRLDIIQGVAHGVAYLHAGSDESVVHRDLKPSNVLLDDNWRPKIADFNTAKLFISDQPDQSDPTIVISPGYASPEYALQGDMTLKCDVYSFGVILLEILSGRRNGPSRGLISSARVFWEQNMPMALLDPVVPLPVSPPNSVLSSELERCVTIGLRCVHEAADDRSDMSTVVAMLATRNENINIPRAAQQDEAAVP
ncbi:hypothetical protein EJB05_39809, partial [Eragrostis curvula]